MATEDKTPLREAAPSASGRTPETPDRSKVARNRIIAGVVIAVVVIVAIFLLTRGDGIIGTITGDKPPVGKVNFHLKGTEFVATQPEGDVQAQKDTAKATADAVKTQLDTLFEKAYVDPGSWGDTGEIGDLFTDGAKGQLKDDIATITLGDNAGDTYDSVDPGKNSAKVRTLTDKDGNALRAAADISFTGLAKHKDGTYSAITVTGTFFFVKDGDTWRIEGYSLDRKEKPAKAPVPKGSSSPSAVAS
ncbi:MAG TPA: hypothetical protein VNF25_01650 [Actinomycetota bacterium]|nr:hypothetical protein [Actinomycetota bacterium]